MSLTQLQAELTGRLPWGLGRVGGRNLNLPKAMKRTLRRTRSRTLSAYRRQYFIADAYRDFKWSASRNEDIFLASLIIALVLGFAVAGTILELLVLSLSSAFAMGEITGIDSDFYMLIAGSALLIIGGWICAFIMNMQSIALMEGATGKIKRSLRRTVRISLQHASRVAGAWLLMLGAVFALPGMLALTAISYARLGTSQLEQFLAAFPVIATLMIAWVVISLLQFSLAPFAALFEPQLRLRNTLRRSAELVTRRGRLFILAGYGLWVLALAGAYILSEGFERTLGLHQGLQIFTWAFFISLLSNGIMVMLYRKRKNARVN
jgi:hypothetical protein